MRIIFVRHGHPDYTLDCLTELGHKHADAVARRLCSDNIKKIYSSSMGRAYQTAEHIAKEVGIPNEDIVKLDFMREIEWDFSGPWEVSSETVRANMSILDPEWAISGPYSKDKITSFLLKRGEDFDNFLVSLGYVREGLYYRVMAENDDTVVVTSHAGSSSAVLSRLFNLPAPFVFDAIRPPVTAVTVVMFKGHPGELISPRFEIVNDARHINGIV